MAIEDAVTIEIRGKKAEVRAIPTGPRAYTFSARSGTVVKNLNVLVANDPAKPLTAEFLQSQIDQARHAVAEMAIAEVEHSELESKIV